MDGLQAYVRKAYGEDPQKSECFPRIISSDHAVRLAKLFNDGDVAFGGKSDPADKYVEPTVILNPKPNSVLLTDEVFGPVLPIVVVKRFVVGACVSGFGNSVSCISLLGMGSTCHLSNHFRQF